jgi:hypothetical protein
MEKKDTFKYVLAAIIILSLVVVMIFMFTHNDDKRYDSPINLCIGALLGAFTTIYTYEFGSSKGSDDKTKLLYNSTPIPPVVPKEEELKEEPKE